MRQTTDGSEQKAAALEALRQGMAIVREGNDIYGVHPDGTCELLSHGQSGDAVWKATLGALHERQHIPETEEGAPESNTSHLVIYTDGGSRGNPGPSASGYVILTPDESQILERGGEYLGTTTNNQAEYRAVAHGLAAARKYQASQLAFYIDSLLVVNQLNGVYKIKNPDLKPLHREIQKACASYEKVDFTHVTRENNRLADEEVNKILDSP